MTHGPCFKGRDTIGRMPPEPVPTGLCYDLWLGPAAKREFKRTRSHRNRLWSWDDGNGDLVSQGMHEVAVARWGFCVMYPTKVSAMGGCAIFDDHQETPDPLAPLCRFDDWGKKECCGVSRCGTGFRIMGRAPAKGRSTATPTPSRTFPMAQEAAWLRGYTKYRTFPSRGQKPGPRRQGAGDNGTNFTEVARSQQTSDLSVTLEDGVTWCTPVHLANISYGYGQTVYFDAEKFQCVGDDEVKRMFTMDWRKPLAAPNLGS